MEERMKKFRLYYDKDKEEIWLNEMCNRGWSLVGFFLGIYTFEPCECGKYIYQIDMPKMSSIFGKMNREKKEYIDFVESTGAEYVCSWGAYVIFRKEASKGEFKLYTDKESKINLYQRIRLLFLSIGILELSMSIIQTLNVTGFMKRFLTYPNGNIFELDGNVVADIVIMMFSLGIIYFVTLVFWIMIIRFTIKIYHLKK